eukprot:NODE_6146_length_600_cov_13.767695_g5740_i0.p1 GENE.NODE_6146_length_600_cov_13.767695_g5740_i0~~NODE_6146_length_600_cov_13.767695_g5740_i0.p1  ORF type:complete len:159 (-),score=16.27 NODE_6146_length_600_cov_13.767695_g5740_i0:66-542(-)
MEEMMGWKKNDQKQWHNVGRSQNGRRKEKGESRDEMRTEIGAKKIQDSSDAMAMEEERQRKGETDVRAGGSELRVGRKPWPLSYSFDGTAVAASAAAAAAAAAGSVAVVTSRFFSSNFSCTKPARLNPMLYALMIAGSHLPPVTRWSRVCACPTAVPT